MASCANETQFIAHRTKLIPYKDEITCNDFAELNKKFSNGKFKIDNMQSILPSMIINNAFLNCETNIN